MANGDTKTEALLNILGNGGDPEPYRGCCNTKTQNYILDAIDRINAIGGEDFTGATATEDGKHGLVPAPQAGDNTKFLKGDGTWAEVQGGGGGDPVAKYDYTTNIAVGGIPVGTEIESTDLLADIVKQMLVTVYYPTFTAPSASLSYSVNNYVKVGSTVSAKTGTVTYNAGAITLQGTKQNDRGGAATGYSLSTSGADTEYSDTNTTGTFSVPALTRSTKGSITLTGTVNYAQGPQPKDSTGADYSTPLPAGSVSATKTFNFIQPFYWGVSSTTTVSDFTGFTESVTAKANKTVSYNTNNQHMVFAYDSSYGNLTSILDPNAFETISGWTKSTLTVDGFTYNVYIADAATTDTGANYTFKF